MRKLSYKIFEFLKTNLIVNKYFRKEKYLKISLLTIVIICCITKVSFCNTIPTLWVNAIKYDYDASSCTNDAITLKNSNGTLATVPEMLYNVRSNKVAYIMGQSNKTIAVQFSTNCPNSNLTISLETVDGESIGEVDSYTITNYTPDSYVYIPLSGTLPNYIGEHQCSWEFSISLTPNVSGYSSVTRYCGYNFSYYTILAAPVYPMNEPWLNVLDYACTYASGTTNTNDALDAIMTNGFAAHYSWDLNCAYLSSDFVKMATSLGIPAVLHKWASKEQWSTIVDDMIAQLINFDPVGSLPYATYIWSWHQWAEANGKQYDPSANTSMQGSWGDYEDAAFINYKVSLGLNTYRYDLNNSGQSIGCEAPAHRDYYSINYFNAWRGPDR